MGVLKEQIDPYLEFVRLYYVNKDPAHNFPHIERIVSCLDWRSQGISPPPNKARLYFLAYFQELETNINSDEQFCRSVRTFFRQA